MFSHEDVPLMFVLVFESLLLRDAARKSHSDSWSVIPFSEEQSPDLVYCPVSTSCDCENVVVG